MDFDSGSFSSGGSGDGAPQAEGAIWLDGDVLACACPECGAPMSIRLWLMLADCFRCGTSIELNSEQEQAALRLLRQNEQQKQAESREAGAAISPRVLRKPLPTAGRPRPAAVARSSPAEAAPAATPVPTAAASSVASASVAASATPAPPVARGGSTPAQPSPHRPRRVAAANVPRGARARVREIHQKGRIAVLLTGLLKDLPAWLVSLVVHLIVILLLGLWVSTPPTTPLSITLATGVDYPSLEGQQEDLDPVALKAFEFDDAGAIAIDSVVEKLGAPSADDVPLVRADVLSEIPRPVGALPEIAAPVTHSVDPMPIGRMFAGRNPEVRSHTVVQAGGTSETEAAVARALEFLSRHQSEDGSWSLDAYDRTLDCDETCHHGIGGAHSDTAGTALALLPFLGASQTHQQGQYQDQVFRGLKWLVEHQSDNGDLRTGAGQMYCQGQAAIVLCEAYGLTRDEQLREPAQSAIRFILGAQHSEGGWRYNPGDPGDTSVVGWQMMALKSGQMAYLYVPAKAFELAGGFLDRVQADKLGGRYSYQPGGGATPAMTAEALLCRQYLGWPKDHPGLRNGVDYLVKDCLPKADAPNIYYWYYATQVMHHVGGRPWERWNAAMRDVALEMQRTTGHAAGSWDPAGSGMGGGFADRGGRIYMTSLATCILEVYYRHMPIYREAALEGPQ